MSAINSYNLTTLDGRDPYIPCGFFFLNRKQGQVQNSIIADVGLNKKNPKKQKHTKIQLLYFEDVEL